MDDAFAGLNLAFSAESLAALNGAIFLIMFGVALDLKTAQFKAILAAPKPVLTGVLSQWVILPALTVGLVALVEPHPFLGMGMVLVACCPGGSVSNFFSSVAGGNVALSISLSMVSTLGAAVITPLSFALWTGVLYGNEWAGTFSLSFVDMIKTLAIILLIPVALGILIQAKFPRTAKRIFPWFQRGSFLVLLAIIGLAFFTNRTVFFEAIAWVFGLVLVHNALALLSGYGLAALLKNKRNDCRTIALETGIQNSGLGLVIIFSFFGGNAGMGLIAAWWGIWHIVAGSSLAWWWRKRPLNRV